MEDETMSLDQLTIGSSAQVASVDLKAAPDVARRLQDLGFSVGTQVTALRTSPLGDPRVYRIADYELALRKEQAALIGLRKLS